MSVITGKDGDVKIGNTQLAEVTSWSFDPEVNVVEYASNKTQGAKRRIAGSKSASGSIEGVFDEDLPIYTQMTEGSEVTLNLIKSPTRKIVVPSVIEKMGFEVNIDDGEIIKWSSDFSSNGNWTYV